VFRTRLAKEITAALVFKAIALAALYFAFFAPPHAPEVSPERVAQDLFEAGAPLGPEQNETAR
jgi:hypothetical protein